MTARPAEPIAQPPARLPALPAPESRRADGWTAERQRLFLESLAEGHSVEAACRIVGLTHQSAYAFRRRAAGAAFALGWNAALLLARQKLADTLLVRAIEGQTETVTRPNGDVIERHRYDNRLASTMLARLDRYADAAANESTHHAARIVAQEFDAFLDTLEGPARAALFLHARADPVTDAAAADAGRALPTAPVAALVRADRYVRTGAGLAAEIDTSDLDPARRADWTAEQWRRAEEAGLLALASVPGAAHAPDAADRDAEPARDPQLPQHSPLDADDAPVWYSDYRRQWRTWFPPPEGFLGDEDGDYGDPDYERELTEEEAHIVIEQRRADLAIGWIVEAKERDAWFDALRATAVSDADGAAVPDPPPHADSAGATAAPAGRTAAPGARVTAPRDRTRHPAPAAPRITAPGPKVFAFPEGSC